jgi:histidyl-tRNA synthetase
LLSEESIKNLEINPILLLLSKEEDEQILAREAPSMIKLLKKDSKLHYAKFKEYLDLLNIPYNEDHTLVSDCDFNTNSIWEFKREDTNERIAF